VQELRRLSLLDTNFTPIQNNKIQPASSFTLSPVQLYSTCDGGTDKYKQLTNVKPLKLALTAIKKLFAL
jgi:hypothetical protein